MSYADALEAATPAARSRALRGIAQSLGSLRLLYTPITPTPKQEVFLRLACDEAFYGGAAGPGKSVALLAAGLQYVDVPGYDALILRQSFPELTQAGGLIPMSHDWLDETDAGWNEQRHEWRFPSGATLSFGHLSTPGAIRRYFGGERHYVGIDESTGFTWGQLRHLFRVLRRPSQNTGRYLRRSPDGLSAADVPLRMRLASNPGGVGHAWHRRRYVKAETRAPGVVFVPARLAENPHVDVASYLAALAHLSPVDRARLIDGDWDVIEAGAIFNRAWLRVERDAPPMTRRVRRWDLAATPARLDALEQTDELDVGARDPDYTVGLLYGQDARREFWILDVIRGRWHAGQVEATVRAAAERDGRDVQIGIAQDPGQAGKSQIRHYARDVLAGFIVRGAVESGSKETRAALPAAAAANMLVHLLDGPWVEEFLDEVTSFPAGHDDQVDAWSGAHQMLTAYSRAQTAMPVGSLLGGR